MEKLQKLVTEFKPTYPVWLLKFLAYGKYNKKFNFKGIEFTSRHIVSFSYIFITLIMIFDYNLYDKKMALISWICLYVWLFFMFSIFLMKCFITYNNIRIKKICKENNINLKEWNEAIFLYTPNEVE